MNYLIDFDNLQVNARSEDKELLEKFIESNKLSLAIALIDNADELALTFNIEEMHSLRANISSDGKPLKDEKEEAEAIWDLMEFGEFPDFTKTLGKKIAKSEEPSRSTKASTKPKRTAAAKPRRSKTPKMLKTGVEPKPNTALHTMWSLVEDNLGEMLSDELVDAYLFEVESTDKLAKRYISKSLRLGHLEEVKEDA